MSEIMRRSENYNLFYRKMRESVRILMIINPRDWFDARGTVSKDESVLSWPWAFRDYFNILAVSHGSFHPYGFNNSVVRILLSFHIGVKRSFQENSMSVWKEVKLTLIIFKKNIKLISTKFKGAFGKLLLLIFSCGSFTLSKSIGFIWLLASA